MAHVAFHLAKRFVGSLRPGPPSVPDDAWAVENLLPGEVRLWRRMSNPDRRHAVGVARDVVDRLGPDVDRSVVTAALLHDSGKVVSGLRTPARVAATLLWAAVDPAAAPDWAASESSVRRRFGQYRLHPRLGAELLTTAGSDPLTIAWAAEHHRPPERWSLPSEIATALHAADDD